MSIFANLQFAEPYKSPSQREATKELVYPIYQVLPSPHVYPGDFIRLMVWKKQVASPVQKSAHVEKKLLARSEYCRCGNFLTWKPGEQWRSICRTCHNKVVRATNKAKAHKLGKSLTVVAK